jgi:hypothetical protein
MNQQQLTQRNFIEEDGNETELTEDELKLIDFWEAPEIEIKFIYNDLANPIYQYKFEEMNPINYEVEEENWYHIQYVYNELKKQIIINDMSYFFSFYFYNDLNGYKREMDLLLYNITGYRLGFPILPYYEQPECDPWDPKYLEINGRYLNRGKFITIQLI